MIYLNWTNDEDILNVINQIGITQAFHILDTVWHDPIKRIKKRNQFFKVLKDNNLTMPVYFHIFPDKRLNDIKDIEKLWNKGV